MRQRLKAAARQIGGLELAVVLLGIAPILVFDGWVPDWAVAGALAAIPLLWLVRWAGHGSPTRPTPLDWPILLLLLMVPVGIWVAADRTRSLPEVYRILLGVALYYALVNTLVDFRYIRWAQRLVVLVTAGLGVAALLSTQWGGVSLDLPLIGSVHERLPTLVRPFWNPAGFNPNIVGGSLAMLLPIVIAAVIGERTWPVRVLGAAAVLTGSLVLLLSQSRGGLIGFALALLAMGVAYSRKFLLVAVVIVLIGIGLVLAVGPLQVGQQLLTQAGDSVIGSLDGRLELWSRALYMVQDFPFTGVGLGMFDPVLDLLYPLFLLGPGSDLFHPHNVLLAQAVMAGIPGLVAFGASLILLLCMALQSVRFSRSGAFWPLAVGLLGSVAAYLGHGLFDSIDSFIKAHTIVWAVFGLQVALWLHLHSAESRGFLGR